MEEKVLSQATLALLYKEDIVNLAFKTESVGADCWNGYGGGVEDFDESIVSAAQRELKEESGVSAALSCFEKVAIIDFHNMKSDKTIFVCRMHVYIVSDWAGKPRQMEKKMITPTEFHKNALPYKKMMPADKEWMPLVLNGKKIIAEFYYGPFQKELIAPSVIKEVDSFDE